MSPRIARLAGIGALGAAAGLVVIYLLFLYATRPGPDAGMDGASRAVTWLSVGGVILALAFAHVVIARQLLTLSRGTRVEP